MKLRGGAHRFGDRVSTDVHISAKYRPPGTTFEELKASCLRELDPGFATRVRPGDMVVAGESFGQVSSREDAAQVLRALGVSCVLAKSFGHMFYRNALNMGLPAIECDTDAIEGGDELEVDPEGGRVVDLTRGLTVPFRPVPPILWRMLRAGGLLPFLKEAGGFSG